MQIFADKTFEKPVAIIEAFDNESFKIAFAQIEDLRKCPDTYLLGYIRYEAKDIFLGKKIKSDLPLLYFEVFKNIKSGGIAIPPYEGELYCNFEEWQNPNLANSKVGILAHQQETNKISSLNLIDYKTYAKAISQIKEEIAQGNTYEVNYTYDWEVKTDLEGFELYKNILPRQKTPYNAYIKNEYEEILSFSPELFFELEGTKIKTKPMKGTVQRGQTEAEDLKNIEFLKNDVKNRAENVMIVDLLRNDLGKIAKTGTVKVDKLFEVETHKTLHQMTSEISAEIEENTSLYEIFNAIFPCGSITGAPKISTMEIIEDIETGSRGVYCGAIGLITPEKTVFSVPIRILQRTLKKQSMSLKTIKNANGDKILKQVQDDAVRYNYRVGGAIVWDSTAEEEWEETKTKIKFLTNLDNNYKIIETILVKDGKLQFEQEHFERMENSAEELGFDIHKQSAPGKVGIPAHQQKTNSPPDFILRILLDKNGDFEIQNLPLNEIKTNVVSISKSPINSKEPLLYHKTTYRPWYEKSMEKIKSGEIFDEIFFNEKGELTEGARSNIILKIDGKLYTPPVECGLLNGVLRQNLLTYPSPAEIDTVGGNNLEPPHLNPLPLGERKNNYDEILKGERVSSSQIHKLSERILHLEDLQKAEKIFCTNSVRGIVEVEL